MKINFETQRSARGRSVSQNKKFGHSLLLSYKLSRIISRNIDRWMNNGQLNMKILIGIFIQALGAKQTLIYEFSQRFIFGSLMEGLSA